MNPNHERGPSSDDDPRVEHSVNWRNVGVVLLAVAVVAGIFYYPNRSQEMFERVYNGVSEALNDLAGVVFGEEESRGNSSNSPEEDVVDNTPTDESEAMGENEAPRENMVTFRWTAYYELVEENGGNHPLEDLIMEFPAPKVTGRERYQPIIDQIAIQSPGRWWIYEDGELKWKSEDFGVRAVLSRPLKRGTRWEWSHGMSYSGYYNRSNGWKLLYSLFNKDVEFEVCMGFKARHVFQVPEDIAGGVTIRDSPWSQEKEHSFNCRYDISGENVGDEVFAVKVGTELERITENGRVMVENAYKKVVWKYRYEVLERIELKSLAE